MMRTLGCVRRALVWKGRKLLQDEWIEAGQVLTLPRSVADELEDSNMDGDTSGETPAYMLSAFCDLTPRALFEVYGVEIPERHALFFTEPCPECRGTAGRVRFTNCAMCANSGRLVFL